MDFQISKISVENVKVNGSEIDEVQYNGVTVWKRTKPEPVYGDDYLCFEPATSNVNNVVSLNNPDMFIKPQYSYDKEKWVDWNGGEVAFGSVNKYIFVRALGMSSDATIRGFNFKYLTYIEGSLSALIGSNRDECGDYAFFGIFKTNMVTNDSDHKIEIPFKKVGNHSLYQTFANSKITVAPDLPATELAPYCYVSLFYYSQIGNLPELPATKLYPYCYNSIFEGCSSQALSDTPIAYTLPSTSLAQGCYCRMFRNAKVNFYNNKRCLTLPAKTLVTECYKQLLEGNSNAKCVIIGATTWNSTYATDWLKNVNSSGSILYQNTAPTNMPTNSNSGVPSGWTLTKQ